MPRTNRTIGLLALAVGLVLAAPVGQAENTIVQASAVSADVTDAVDNDLDVYIGGDWRDSDGNAVANCNWLLSVDAIFLNIVAIDSLAVISDEDLLAIGLPVVFGRGGDHLWKLPHTQTIISNGTATCEQDIGHVHVHIEKANGWGEPAPQASDLASAMGGWTNNHGGTGGGNTIVQAAAASAYIDDVVENDADVFIYGNGNAVANCQLLVAWGTHVLNVGLIKQTAIIKDDDQLVIGRPPEENNGPVVASEPDWLEKTPKTRPDTYAHGTAHCKQKVAAIILSTGDKVDRIPWES